MARIVCFGELLVRLSAPGRELLFQSGQLEVHVGGAEANVAVGLSNLGHSTAMVSRLPDNSVGEAAIQHLRRYGVAIDGIARDPGRMGLYFVSPGAGVRPPCVTYDREFSSFALASADSYNWDQRLDGADLLHLSGITPALGNEPAAAVLAAAKSARAKGMRVSFDGNYRAQLWAKRSCAPRPVLSQLIESADTLFGNHRDISLLIGREFSGEGTERRREAALAAFEAFPNLQMIASTARKIVACDHHRISARIDTRDDGVETAEIDVAGIVDRIGTGDAFATGILHGLLTGCELGRTADLGLALACLKHGLPGDASLFGQDDIDSFLDGEREVRR